MERLSVYRLVKQEIQNRFEELGNRGFRILGVCYRNMVNWTHDDNSTLGSSIAKDDES